MTEPQVRVSKFSSHFERRWRERVGSMCSIRGLNRRLKTASVYWQKRRLDDGKKHCVAKAYCDGVTVVIQPGSWTAITVYRGSE